jgi:2-(1,2-epoxy-1,2-dihydrophenyl)acetyl-CoA isomerase
MSEAVEVTIDNQIGKVMLNRPDVYNAFDLDTIKILADALIALAVRDSVRAVIVSGRGKAFSAGGDLIWVNNFPGGPSAAFHELASHFNQVVVEIRRMNKPIIAAINGIAAGGGFSLALACDFRIMSQTAVLKQGYTSNGLCIDGGGTYYLPRLVGLTRALEIVAFDKPISAEQALEWGLVTKVVESGKEMAEAEGMAVELSGISLHSFGLSKKLLTDSYNTSFEAHIEMERLGIERCGSHPDGIEGMDAFLNKRTPLFNRKG